MASPLNLRQRFVQDVAGIRVRDEVISITKSPDYERQILVAAVGRNDPVWIDVKLLGDLTSNLRSQRIGIHIQPPVRRASDRFRNLWRRQIRILVGVEFRPARVLWLLAGNIPGHAVDIRSNE